MKRHVVIEREWQDENQTIGKLTVYDGCNKPVFTAISLERGWRFNQKNISCVPSGVYPIVLEWSPKFQKRLWELKKVPNRSECKFHAANFWFQLNGCISLGFELGDINKDGYHDVLSSALAMIEFHNSLKGMKKAKLTIYNKNDVQSKP